MHTDGIFLGESVNPGPITDICVVGDALIMRGYLPSLRWFQYKNGMKIFLPENGIVAICHDVNVNGVSGTDAAVSQNKVYGVVYGLATYCELQDKETVVSGSRAIQMYTADSKPNFILSNQEQFQFIVDEYARVVMLNIDSIPRQYFDAVIPVDGNPGHLIVVFDGRQYLVESREAQELLSSFDNSVHTAQKVGDYTSVLSETGIETFQKYGKNVLFVPIDGGERIDASSMCKLYDGNVVICGANGLYRFISDAIYRISDIYRPSALTMDNSSEHLAFAVGSGGTLYKSSNCKKWESVLQIPDAAAINNIYVKNQMEFYISTSNGLYRTVYSYNLVNDFESRNEFEMREFVQQLSGELDIIYNADFQRHLAKYHSGSSPITRINDAALSVNLDTPAPDWCTSSNGPEYIVNNGMVYSMDFGDYTTGVFHVDLSSYLGNFSNVEAEYITKNYMGGVSELFIHVDTTNNYYLNFMDGTPNCTSAQAATPRTRRNLENSPTIPKTHRQQDSIVSSHYTTITVGLNA